MHYHRIMIPSFLSMFEQGFSRAGNQGGGSTRAPADQAGFTLIEVIAVFILMGVLAAMAISRSLDATGEAEVAGATEVVKNHLRYAQVRAMNADLAWGLNFAGSSYTLRDANGATASLPGDLPQGMTFVASVNPVMFEKRWGSPGGTTILVTVTKGAVSRTITVTRKTGFIP